MDLNDLECCSSSLIAMTGKKCVAIAVFGKEAGDNKNALYRMSTHLYLGMIGSQQDIIELNKSLIFHKNIFEAEHCQELKPEELTAFLSAKLYEQRSDALHVELVIAGLNTETLKPYLCSMDAVGCANVRNDFVFAGHQYQGQLMIPYEELWQPKLSSEQLYNTMGTAMKKLCYYNRTVEWKANICLIEPYKITERSLSTNKNA